MPATRPHPQDGNPPSAQSAASSAVRPFLISPTVWPGPGRRPVMSDYEPLRLHVPEPTGRPGC
ncbi:TPA: hypothetical protein L4873_003750, partial [Pseudomonas aeruginosa]|nr:hypothetical protein [Pseudomonas aeruginosa]